MDLTIAILLIVQHQVSSTQSLYSELEYLGGSCFPRDSCTPSRVGDGDHLWANYTCECGEHCIRYGTCCADSPHFGKMLHVENRGEICKKLPTSSETVIMVSRCSDRWRYGFPILNKCETDYAKVEDPVSMVPVTNLVTLVTYKNYFCAMCNYDTRDVFMWDIALQLGITESTPSLFNVTEDYLLENILYDKEKQSWGIIANNDVFHEIKLQFKIPSPIRKFVKKCYPKMISQCNSSYGYNYELQYKCLSYYAPIKVKDGDRHFKKYRNIHCAVCNNVNVSQIDGNICKLDVDRRNNKPGFSFALLLDINRSDGDQVGKMKLCSDTEKWDPFFKKCRSLACALPGHVIKDGKCVDS